MKYKNLLDIPFQTSDRFPERISHKDMREKNTVTVRYSEFTGFIRVLTAGFKYFGVDRKEHVSFFVNNRYEWTATDFALIALGAVSVPRGSDSTPAELQFIFSHSDSEYLILENIRQAIELSEVFLSENWEKCRKIFIMDNAEDLKLPPVLAETPTPETGMTL